MNGKVGAFCVGATVTVVVDVASIAHTVLKLNAARCDCDMKLSVCR
jgi:hypothetical protein